MLPTALSDENDHCWRRIIRKSCSTSDLLPGDADGGYLGFVMVWFAARISSRRAEVMQYNCPSNVVRIFSFVLFGILFAVVGAPAQSDIGTIDHARDIKAAQDVYRNTLGFNLFRPEPIVFEEGSAHNSTGRLSDGTYLELIGVVNEQKLLRCAPGLSISCGVTSKVAQTPVYGSAACPTRQGCR